MVIFGLGNPGVRYRNTRHNVGYIFVNRFARKLRKRFRTIKGYKILKTDLCGKDLVLTKPQCWMNNSGYAVAQMVFDHEDEEFIVVIDDVNLPLGKARLRKKGSDGGHQGLRSIIEALDSEEFIRLRIGVGRTTQNLVDYVLSPFSRGEERILDSVMGEAIHGVEILITLGFQRAQSYINGIDLTDSDA